MTQLERSTPVPSPPAPVERSVRALFEVTSSDVLWGASWAFACGAIAALPWHVSPAGLASAVVAWFVAVPLLGAVWAPASRRGQWGARPDTGALIACALCVSLAVLLGAGVFSVVLAGLAVIAACWAVWRRPPRETGAARSVLEIAVPALIGWLALGGPATLPPWMRVAEGAVPVAQAWLAANWVLPAVVIGFTLIHHGATAPEGAGFARRRIELVLGYVIAAAALAVAGRPLSAGAVALLFAVQWPFQVELERGRQGWHFRSTQGLTMLAMLVAAIGAGVGRGIDAATGPG